MAKTNQVTQEQIDAWKAKFKNIFKITVEDKVCYLKAPDRKTLSFASSVGTKDPIKFNEILLKNCWLAGDDEIKTDDTYFMSAATQLSELIEIKEAKLEKL